MALTEFSYAYSNAQLKDILNLSMELVVGDDLRNFEIREKSSLHFLLNEGGFGHGAGFEISAHPENAVGRTTFYVIQGDIFGYSKNGGDIAIFTPAEIRVGISDEIRNQVQRNPIFASAAKSLREMFDLNEI
jgi:hypothetical protein